MRWLLFAMLVFGIGVGACASTPGAIARSEAQAWASWYGPGLYGNRLACGGRLGYRTRGVAHKTLPCGTRIRLCYRRCVTVRVVDRGPFIPGREFDLTAQTAIDVRFGEVPWRGRPSGVRRVRWSR